MVNKKKSKCKAYWDINEYGAEYIMRCGLVGVVLNGGEGTHVVSGHINHCPGCGSPVVTRNNNCTKGDNHANNLK